MIARHIILQTYLDFWLSNITRSDQHCLLLLTCTFIFKHRRAKKKAILVPQSNHESESHPFNNIHFSFTVVDIENGNRAIDFIIVNVRYIFSWIYITLQFSDPIDYRHQSSLLHSPSRRVSSRSRGGEDEDDNDRSWHVSNSRWWHGVCFTRKYDRVDELFSSMTAKSRKDSRNLRTSNKFYLLIRPVAISRIRTWWCGQNSSLLIFFSRIWRRWDQKVGHLHDLQAIRLCPTADGFASNHVRLSDYQRWIFRQVSISMIDILSHLGVSSAICQKIHNFSSVEKTWIYHNQAHCILIVAVRNL